MLFYDKDDEIIKEFESKFDNFKINENKKNFFIDKSSSGKDLSDYLFVVPMTEIEFDDYDSIIKNDLKIEGFSITTKYVNNAMLIIYKKENKHPIEEGEIILSSYLEED